MNTGSLELQKGYFQRNQKLLTPLAATLVLATAPAMLTTLGGFQVPAWLPPVGMALGCLLTGIWAMLLDTLTARMVRVMGLGLAAGFLAAAIFH